MMELVRILTIEDRWKLTLPAAWRDKERGTHDYVETADKRFGLYIKPIGFRGPNAPKTAHKGAAILQDVHVKAFADVGAVWRVMSREDEPGTTLAKSRLDTYDVARKYRILSVVWATAEYALWLTFHDYLCPDYEAARKAFDEIVASVEGPL